MPWPWQACQFLIHLHLFIQLTFQRCQKVWGMFYWDIIWGSNLEFGLVKTTTREGNFFEKILALEGSLKLLTKCQKSKKVDIIWYLKERYLTYIHKKRYYSTICLLKSCHIHTFVLRNTHFQNVSTSLNSFFL